MNRETVQFDLNEALIHLADLQADLRGGKMNADDAPALAVALGHILDHLCLAWNARDLSPQQKAELSEEERDRMYNTIPNLHGERQLGDVAGA